MTSVIYLAREVAAGPDSIVNPTSTQNQVEEMFSDDVLEIIPIYVRDSRANPPICFAIFSRFQVSGMTAIPCKQIAHLLESKKNSEFQ